MTVAADWFSCKTESPGRDPLGHLNNLYSGIASLLFTQIAGTKWALSKPLRGTLTINPGQNRWYRKAATSDYRVSSCAGVLPQSTSRLQYLLILNSDLSPENWIVFG